MNEFFEWLAIGFALLLFALTFVCLCLAAHVLWVVVDDERRLRRERRTRRRNELRRLADSARYKQSRGSILSVQEVAALMADEIERHSR